MSEKIYDIPLWDAFNEDCECPLCVVEKKAEDQFIDALFTEMVMDVRLAPELVDDYFFCKEHFEKLYRYPDKLGLAIITDRILIQRSERLKNPTPSLRPKSSFPFKKKASLKVKDSTSSCLLCKKLIIDMDNYTKTMIKLWLKEDKFRTKYFTCKGFCLKHYDMLIFYIEDMVKNEDKKDKFMAVTTQLQGDNIDRMHEELLWFINKYDYRYQTEPWKTSKDALIRTLQKLVGNYYSKL
ncbi:MAG TPA: DUF6062 family protein [Clostridiaceae bacterium]